MDTETVEQGYKATSFPFLPSPPTPPFAECIVTIHTLQSKEAMMTTYGTFFFFEKRKIQQPLLKFSIKIHICIIIHFKAIREE